MVRQAKTYVILVGKNVPLPSSIPIDLGPSGRRKEFGPQEYNFQVGLETGSFNPLHLAGVITSAHLLSGGANSYLIWLTTSPPSMGPLWVEQALTHDPASHQGWYASCSRLVTMWRTTGFGLGQFAFGQLAH